jgi:hypothetical protein
MIKEAPGRQRNRKSQVWVKGGYRICLFLIDPPFDKEFPDYTLTGKSVGI